MVFLTLFAAIITADNTKKAPKLAAIAKDQLEIEFVRKKPPKTEEPKIKRATPKLAPDEIPKTNGPASGFLNKVCMSNPQIERPEPTKMAVIAFGNLKSKIMVCQLSLIATSPMNVLKIALKGMETEPKLMFRKKKTISKTESTIKCFLYVFFSIDSGLVECS